MTFLAIPESELEEVLASLEMIEDHGLVLTGFGDNGALIPRSREVLQAARALGFTEEGADQWASAASAFEDNSPFEEVHFDAMAGELAMRQWEAEAEQDEASQGDMFEGLAESRGLAARLGEEELLGTLEESDAATPIRRGARTTRRRRGTGMRQEVVYRWGNAR